MKLNKFKNSIGFNIFGIIFSALLIANSANAQEIRELPVEDPNFRKDMLEFAQNACKKSSAVDFVEAFIRSPEIANNFTAKNILIIDKANKKTKKTYISGKKYKFPIRQIDNSYILDKTLFYKNQQNLSVDINQSSDNRIVVSYTPINIEFSNDEGETFNVIGDASEILLIPNGECWKIIQETRK